MHKTTEELSYFSLLVIFMTREDHSKDEKCHISATGIAKRVSLLAKPVKSSPLKEGGDQTGSEERSRESWHWSGIGGRDWCVGGGCLWNDTSAGWLGVARATSWVVASWGNAALRLPIHVLRAGCWCRAAGGTLRLPIDILRATDWCSAAVALRLPIDVLGAYSYWCGAAALWLPVYVLGAHDWDHAALWLPIDVLRALHHHG